MNHSLTRSLGLGLAIAAVAAAPAEAQNTLAQTATTSVDTSMCTTPQLTQPFLSWQDTNLYALAPGETPGSFNGAGWVLSGGAKVITRTLANGTTSSVLDLPAGSKAVSPTVCLTSAYPTARMMVSNPSGTNGGTVGFSVSYAGTSSATSPLQTGTFKTTGQLGVTSGWGLSDPVALAPSSNPGWQPMQITLTAGASKELAVYNLYLDPRMR